MNVNPTVGCGVYALVTCAGERSVCCRSYICVLFVLGFLLFANLEASPQLGSSRMFLV